MRPQNSFQAEQPEQSNARVRNNKSSLCSIIKVHSNGSEVWKCCLELEERNQLLRQPNMEKIKIAAGNFLLNFAILVAGASISKVQHVFTHMGMACISLSTFFRHQKVG